MATVTKIVLSMMGLILLYLIVTNGQALNDVLNKLGVVSARQIGALQGR